MPTEEQVNKKIDDGIERYFNENRRMQNGVISNVDEVRREILDLLLRYANEDGTISDARIRQILAELGVSEASFERKMADSLDDIVDRTSDRAINVATAALGALLVAGALNIPNIKRRAREDVLERRFTDGMSFSDRIWRMSGSLMDNVRTVVRSGVLRGDSVTTLTRRLAQTFRENEYHVRRIILTEGYNVFRRTLGIVAGDSGVVQAVKIIDHRGRHPYHETHECYRLAEQDMYGWGKGVYRVEDDFIYYPHPQCTSYLRFVLVDGETGGVISNA